MPPTEPVPVQDPVEEKPVEQAVEEEAPANDLPDEVLPPEDESTTPAKPTEGTEEGQEGAEAPEPSASDLQARLDALEQENATLKAGQPASTPPAQPTARMSMSDVYKTYHKPKIAAAYVAEKDPGKQFEILHDTVDKMIGVVYADRVEPLIASHIGLYNELEVRDLRSDPDFVKLEPQVREQLNKTDWKSRAGDTPVADIFHRLRGAKKNGTAKAVPPAKGTPAAAVRKTLKDVASGGGASPKPAGIRLTKDQEADYQQMTESGWPGSRAEYYAKLRARQDQAKAEKKPIPSTYRG